MTFILKSLGLSSKSLRTDVWIMQHSGVVEEACVQWQTYNSESVEKLRYGGFLCRFPFKEHLHQGLKFKDWVAWVNLKQEAGIKWTCFHTHLYPKFDTFCAAKMHCRLLGLTVDGCLSNIISEVCICQGETNRNGWEFTRDMWTAHVKVYKYKRNGWNMFQKGKLPVSPQCRINC